ncbi:glycosyl hydrolase family 18 protein [Paenibacillus xanthanilyticus]|uniref:Glycosyl hydrolase family 18 protein n=1 Tax=Paenibacillus xanthanilyticus TaxID=1783531 RepID=A0ABV8K510_9BACL
MTKKWSLLLAGMIAAQGVLTAGASAATVTTDLTTKYRVYQNDKALKEFKTDTQAIAYAKSFAYSHIEKITDRVWVWDNFPRYKVYENGVSTPAREFKTLDQAKAFAKKLKFAQIRDLQQPGWISYTYPKYQLYQGDNTSAAWSFATLAQAKLAAKYYANAHVMDLSANQWVWDNLTAAQKTAKRASTPIYIVTVAGEAVNDASYGFLADAIRASAGIPGSAVLNTSTGKVVHQNAAPYVVNQNGRAVRSFFNLEGAIAYAKALSGTTITKDGLEWWTNIPYFKVVKDDEVLKQFFTRQSAVAHASQVKNAVVMSAEGRALWNNVSKLKVLGWNGTSSTKTVLAQVSQTQGLDTTSPTWFVLTNADGTMMDNSDPAVIASLQGSGIKVEPLVHNQFDKNLTRAFLQNPAAQTKFIASLVARLDALGLQGMNLDFEGMYGGDRALYTEFVRNLAKSLHAKGMTLSIDLPRGDVKWNALTAYDIAAIGQIVDTVMIMAYDEHWSGSDEPGSVGGMDWIEEGIEQYLAYGVPRDKLMLGIPFYVREWRIDASGNLVDNKAIYMKEVPRIIQENGATGTYDAESGQIKYTYAKDGYTHVFWAETTATVKARVELARKYDLAGVAAWRLGYESADLWSMLLQYK